MANPQYTLNVICTEYHNSKPKWSTYSTPFHLTSLNLSSDLFVLSESLLMHRQRNNGLIKIKKLEAICWHPCTLRKKKHLSYGDCPNGVIDYNQDTTTLSPRHTKAYGDCSLLFNPNSSPCLSSPLMKVSLGGLQKMIRSAVHGTAHDWGSNLQ